MKNNWNKKWSWRLFGLAIVAGAYGGYVTWFAEDRMDLGEGFASANGRIEGVEIDVAAETAGRVAALLVDEGEFVKAGDVLARMDTAVLAAQLREAQAQLRQAKSSVAVAHSQVTQRESEKAAADAVVAQREVERDVAKKRVERTESLAKQTATSEQQLDEGLRIETIDVAVFVDVGGTEFPAAGRRGTGQGGSAYDGIISRYALQGHVAATVHGRYQCAVGGGRRP